MVKSGHPRKILQGGISMHEWECIQDLSREQLLEYVEMQAKNWLALDGTWFQSLEQLRGMDEAMLHDERAWARYTVFEARRIKKFLGLPEHPGLEGLRRALNFRLYAAINRYAFSMEENGRVLIYRVLSCRVQDARLRKGMSLHPCRPVGLVEYSGFAREIDSRIQTQCLSCCPEITDTAVRCAWKFTLLC